MVRAVVQPADVSRFKERVRNAREQEILQAARDVFAERGFDEASIDEIADRVGIGKGTVYLHFSSKMEILGALMQHMSDEVAAISRQKMASCADAAAKLHTVMQVLVDYHFHHRTVMRICAMEASHFLHGQGNDRAPGQAIRDLLLELIEEGKREGVIDSRVDDVVAAKALPMMVLVSAYDIANKKLTKQQVLESVEQMYFHGITKEARA